MTTHTRHPTPLGQEPDRTTLWGVWASCGVDLSALLGIIFGYLSIRDARSTATSPVLGYLAIAFGGVITSSARDPSVVRQPTLLEHD